MVVFRQRANRICLNYILLGFNVTLLLYQFGFIFNTNSEHSGGQPSQEVVVFGLQPTWYAPIIRWHYNWDGRGTDDSNDKLGFAGGAWRKIFLIRHGQYFGFGENTGKLTTLGEKQAHILGQRLKHMNITFHSLLTSSSVRTKETANILHIYMPHLEMDYDEDLKEGWPSFPDPVQPGFDPHDLQKYDTDRERIDRAFKRYIHRADKTQNKDTNEIIVAHGNIISYFILRALQTSPERWVRLSIYQASLSIIEIGPDGGVYVKMVGDIGHLPSIHMWTG